MSYYRRYAPRLAKIAAPLTELLKTGNPLVWQDAQEAAFRTFKKLMTEAPVLGIFVPDNDVEVHCDASPFAIGAELRQNGRPIAFESRKLSSPKINYPTHEMEQLAVVHALTKWRVYFHSIAKPFVIYTDHESRKYLQSKNNLSPRQIRWNEKLAEYNFEIRYRKGSLNIVPDVLSRRPDYQLSVTTVSAQLLVTTSRPSKRVTDSVFPIYLSS